VIIALGEVLIVAAAGLCPRSMAFMQALWPDATYRHRILLIRP